MALSAVILGKVNSTTVASTDYPRAERRLNVFLSYSTADRDRAARIAEALDQAGLHVIHPQQAALGQDIFAGIVEAIDQSDVAVFLVSDASASSSWVGSELAYAMAVRLHGGRTRIVPVILDKGVEPPPLLRGLQFFDVSDPAAFEVNVTHLAQLLKVGDPTPPSLPEEERLTEVLDLRRRNLEVQIAEYERERQAARERLVAFTTSLGAASRQLSRHWES